MFTVHFEFKMGLERDVFPSKYFFFSTKKHTHAATATKKKKKKKKEPMEATPGKKKNILSLAQCKIYKAIMLEEARNIRFVELTTVVRV